MNPFIESWCRFVRLYRAARWQGLVVVSVAIVITVAVTVTPISTWLWLKEFYAARGHRKHQRDLEILYKRADYLDEAMERLLSTRKR